MKNLLLSISIFAIVFSSCSTNNDDNSNVNSDNTSNKVLLKKMSGNGYFI